MPFFLLTTSASFLHSGALFVHAFRLMRPFYIYLHPSSTEQKLVTSYNMGACLRYTSRISRDWAPCSPTTILLFVGHDLVYHPSYTADFLCKRGENHVSKTHTPPVIRGLLVGNIRSVEHIPSLRTVQAPCSVSLHLHQGTIVLASPVRYYVEGLPSPSCKWYIFENNCPYSNNFLDKPTITS